MNERVFMFQLESMLIATLNYFISHEILNYLQFFLIKIEANFTLTTTKFWIGKI